MKTLFTLFAFLLIYNIGISQPIVNADILLEIGDEHFVSYAEVDFNPGPAGENVVWDFGNVAWSSDVTWLAVDPETTGFADSFPSADLAFFIPGDTSLETYSDGWVFYDVDDGQEISLLGSIIFSYSAEPTYTNYFYLNEDPDLLFQFPMTYADQFADDIVGVSYVHFMGQVFEVDRTGTTTTHVDGYGTLITPYGTFNDVIRVKRTEDIEDVFGVFVTYQEVVRYDWYSPIHNYLLYHTEEIIIRDAAGVEQNRTSQTYYAEPVLITDVTEVHTKEVTVYPNPCTEVLNLPAEVALEATSVAIFDLQGRKVFSDKGTTKQLDVAFLETGMYLLVITGNDGRHSQTQFVKK